MRLVSLESLNRLRYADNPMPLQTLRHWCRLGPHAGGIPAIKQGREWMVDLESFDTHCREQSGMRTPLAAAVVLELSGTSR